MAINRLFIIFIAFFLISPIIAFGDVIGPSNDVALQRKSEIEKYVIENFQRLSPEIKAGNINNTTDALNGLALEGVLRYARRTAQKTDIDVFRQLELEYGLSADGTDRFSLWAVQPLYASPNDAHSLFMQGGYMNMDGRDTAGADLIYRYMTPDKQHLIGGHLGFDHQWPFHHSRLLLGLDYKSHLFGARATHYVGFSDIRDTEAGLEEKVMDGTDVELSVRPYGESLPELEVFARGFHWADDGASFTKSSDDVSGYEVAAEYTPINAITLRAGVTDDNARPKPTGEATVRFNYHFGNDVDELLARPTCNGDTVENLRFDPVRRDRAMQFQSRVAAPSPPEESVSICNDGATYNGSMCVCGGVARYNGGRCVCPNGGGTWDGSACVYL